MVVTMPADASDIRRSAFQRLGRRVDHAANRLHVPEAVAEGRLVNLSGMRLQVEGLNAGIGSRCLIHTARREGIEAEVIGFDGDRLILMCEGGAEGLKPGARVTQLTGSGRVAVGADLLGRVIDGAGQPLDGFKHKPGELTVPLRGGPINPMDRAGISSPMDVGVRAINSLVTIGRGQRMGLFAGSGVGKSTLLGMMTRFTEADVIVVGLVGERGREVREFVEDSLGPEGLARAVVVATPADTSPLMRVAGCWRATAIAEYYRAQGLNVLLLIDSLTRFAHAQREIGLAAGEPPVSRGYTPSVFSLLPNLIERAGNVGAGSITAIYTVLTEGDDLQDPIADSARAILDGHIVLSRQTAESGLFPAIDVEASVSRSMLQIVEPEHLQHARLVKEAYATYRANRDLISVGAYRQGSDPKIDMAIHSQEAIRSLVEQPLNQPADFSSSLKALDETVSRMQVTQVVEPAGHQGRARPQMGGQPPALAR
jgi:flagellum-specific ATP synthase